MVALLVRTEILVILLVIGLQTLNGIGLGVGITACETPKHHRGYYGSAEKYSEFHIGSIFNIHY